jgi:PAS domain S-box-containing protein
LNKKEKEQDKMRKAVEAKFAHEPKLKPKPRPSKELLHELRVYQIELEMQNEEFRQAQLDLKEMRDRYVDLYEFSPDGYLTLTSKGLIAEVNLTGAALLRVERKKLIKRRFADFVTHEDRDHWHRHFLSIWNNEGHQSFELLIQRGDSSRFHARLDCIRKEFNNSFSVRITLIDITDRKHSEQQLRELSAHLHTVREEEKASFAREIHDELGSTLSALKIEASRLNRGLSAKQKTMPLFSRVESMVGLLDVAMAATRSIITELRPSMLDDLGLMAALEWHAEQFHKRTGIECKVVRAKSNGLEDRLDRTLSIGLFRIFQEALNNVARHSGASRVGVELRSGGNEVILSISDNGCGLPDGYAVAPTSYGIRGMLERVGQMGGKIDFDSLPGSGLSVTVKLPLSGTPQKKANG